MGRISHDLKHQIVALLAKMDPERTSQNFTQLEALVQRYDSQQHAGNPMLDAVLPIKEYTCAPIRASRLLQSPKASCSMG